MDKKTFEELVTGDTIYYVNFDVNEEKFKVFEHKIFMRKKLKESAYVEVDILINPGDYISHGIKDLCLPKNETTHRWVRPHDSSYPVGLCISVDYEEAKKECVKMMFEYCEILIENCNRETKKMFDALKKYKEMMKDF